MAQAPGHRLGQIIGDTLELAVGPRLAAFADDHGLYLDGKGKRAARPGKKVTWRDDLGNTHDLDHVLERGGTETKLGVPVAFIETAWRRYTKHSRNKAQEIQGAILPLLTTWAHAKPFAGVVLAGVWTAGSLNQLRSNGFAILHIPYETIVEVFRGWNIEVFYEEDTDDSVLRDQIDRYALSEGDREDLGQALRDAISTKLDEFIDELDKTVLRRIESVAVLPRVRYEATVRFDHGDPITAEFDSQAETVAFLDSFR